MIKSTVVMTLKGKTMIYILINVLDYLILLYEFDMLSNANT